MSGTDKTQTTPPTGGPVIILVEPQLGENIGMVARAMLNCGLTKLRLVEPRDGWPSEKAQAAASGADIVLDGAQVFETTAAAVADLERLYAATARPRGMVKTVVTPRQAALEMHAAPQAATGILFGPERSGLINDDIALADAALAVPLNPTFASLNLAQAVLLAGYEWYQACAERPARSLETNAAAPASKSELINFFERLEGALDETGFLLPVEKRPRMVRNLRNLFGRIEATQAEVDTLHGIISALRFGRGQAHGGAGKVGSGRGGSGQGGPGAAAKLPAERKRRS